MIRFNPDAARSRRPVRAVLAIALLAGVAGLYACAPKITKVDTAYTMPEGVVSPDAQLIVWRDQPTTAYIYFDKVPADPDSTDSLITTTQFEAFHFVDTSPSGYSPASYVARGIVEGIVNVRSPLTNLASPPAAPLANINLVARWWNPSPASTFNPKFGSAKIKLKWDLVPGAVRYILHVYDFRGDLHSDYERFLSGTPAPFYDGQSSDIFFGFVPGSVNFMFVGDSSRTDITTITARPLAPGNSYLIRLTALDAAGHMIAMSQGDPNPQRAYADGSMGVQRLVLGNNTYMLYRLGATTVRDTTPPPPPPGSGGDR